MALKDERPLLLFGTLCVLAGGYLFTIYPGASKTFSIYTIETTMTWKEGPNVRLDAARLKKLNEELDTMISKETRGQILHYPVISLDKKWVEVMYVGDGPLPTRLQGELDGHIQARLPELAREQVASQKP